MTKSRLIRFNSKGGHFFPFQWDFPHQKSHTERMTTFFNSPFTFFISLTLSKKLYCFKMSFSRCNLVNLLFDLSILFLLHLISCRITTVGVMSESFFGQVLEDRNRRSWYELVVVVGGGSTLLGNDGERQKVN